MHERRGLKNDCQSREEDIDWRFTYLKRDRLTKTNFDLDSDDGRTRRYEFVVAKIGRTKKTMVHDISQERMELLKCRSGSDHFVFLVYQVTNSF